MKAADECLNKARERDKERMEQVVRRKDAKITELDNAADGDG